MIIISEISEITNEQEIIAYSKFQLSLHVSQHSVIIPQAHIIYMYYQKEAVLCKRQVISPHPHNTSSYMIMIIIIKIIK